ncbi:MAG: NAD(P)-dependent oxidoreductase [Bacteroidota bacterium]|nr:NAD(P)-dependent oxidoreductase [Bacteroidota bacterium]
MEKCKIGLIKERKNPPDSRVALTPIQLSQLTATNNELIINIESSKARCFKDEEYRNLKLNVVENVSDCQLLLGVKEVPIEHLIEGKDYMFFSHTFKKQLYNRNLLKTVLKKNIRLIDYEIIVDENGIRLIGFGKYAGIVGTHYALLMWGKKTGAYDFKRAVECYDYNEMIKQYENANFGKARIIVTGTGKVSNGCILVLDKAKIKRVSSEEFLTKKFDEAVYLQIDVDEINKHKEGKAFEFQHFFDNPKDYESKFEKYLSKTDILINGMYWDIDAPRLFTKEDVTAKNFNIKVISDVSCDINGSVPITIKATTIANPYYGFDADKMQECDAFTKKSIDMMTVDNLPNELPRDASIMFGSVMLNKLIPLYLKDPHHEILQNATIAENGKLKEKFSYLQDYVDGK